MAWKEPRALAIDARSLDERAAALRQALGEREANALIGKRPDVLLASTSKLSDVAAALELSLGLTRANATRLAARVASTAPRRRPRGHRHAIAGDNEDTGITRRSPRSARTRGSSRSCLPTYGMLRTELKIWSGSSTRTRSTMC